MPAAAWAGSTAGVASSAQDRGSRTIGQTLPALVLDMGPPRGPSGDHPQLTQHPSARYPLHKPHTSCYAHSTRAPVPAARQAAAAVLPCMASPALSKHSGFEQDPLPSPLETRPITIAGPTSAYKQRTERNAVGARLGRCDGLSCVSGMFDS